MLHQEGLYQLRQQRNHALMIEAQQTRITQKLVRNHGVRASSTSGTNRLQLIMRYARAVFSIFITLASESR